MVHCVKINTQVGTLILAILASLTFGCISVPKREVSPLVLPERFSAGGTVKNESQWWLDFDDEMLNHLIDKALSDNFNLLIARDRITEAAAVARQAGASLYPRLDSRVGGSVTRDYNENTTRENYPLVLGAAYEIDLWGRLRSLKKAALLELSATEADFQTGAISLGAEVAAGWYQLVETNLRLQLLLKQQEINRTVLEVITAQFRSGKTGIADVLQQRQLIESNSSDLATLQAEIQVLFNRLQILLGETAGTESIISLDSLPGTLPELQELPDTGIPFELLTRRPDIQSAFFRLQSSDQKVAASVADRLPRLSISAELSSGGSTASDLFDNWLSTLAANLFTPVFDAGQRKNIVKKNQSLARQQFFRYGQTVLEALAEVENTLVREDEQLAILASREIQLKLAAETIEHVGNRYRQGAEDYQRVLLALLSHQNLERDILRTRLQLISNRITLYRSLSGRIVTLADVEKETELLKEKSSPSRGKN